MAARTDGKLDDRARHRPDEQAPRRDGHPAGEGAATGPDPSPPLSREEAIREMEAIRRSLEGRYTGDPTAEIREDRDSR